MRKHRRLPAWPAGFGNQIPHGRAGNFEAAASFGDADAGIIVNESACFNRFEQACAFVAVGRLGGQARGRALEFGPRHFPERERGGVAVIQNRVGFRAVRDEDKRRVKNFLREFRWREISRQQVASGKMFQAARDGLRLRDGGFFLPDFVHAAMVNFPAADGNAFCRLAEKNLFV